MCHIVVDVFSEFSEYIHWMWNKKKIPRDAGEDFLHIFTCKY